MYTEGSLECRLWCVGPFGIYVSCLKMYEGLLHWLRTNPEQQCLLAVMLALC